MSKTDRSKWSGAGLQTRSCSPSPAQAAAHVDEGERGAVRDHHALRRAGRPGRVQDVGEVGLDRPVRRPAPRPVPPAPRPRARRPGPAGRGPAAGPGSAASGPQCGPVTTRLRSCGNGAGHRGCPLRRSLVGQHHGDAAVGHDGGQPRGGRLRVERDIAGPGLQHAEHGHHRGGRLGGEDPHPVARRHALRQQRAGDLVAQPVQLVVAEEPLSRRPPPGRSRCPRRAVRQQVLQQICHCASAFLSCRST